MIPNVLSVAGSDPSGGAGVQADLKAISANGAYAMAAITALTAQNTRGVFGVQLVEPAFVARQIAEVFADVEVAAVKIGMIATADIAHAVADALEAAGARRIVLDPVMVAKGGDRLLAEDAVEALASRLAPMADVLTPNLPEASALLGRSAIGSRAGMVSAAHALRDRGAQAVLLKGGHLDGASSPDFLSSEAGDIWFDAPRTATKNTHGTGCTLSSALAAQLALGRPVAEAAAAAKAYVTRAIEAADGLSVGSGHGPLDHFYALRGG